MGLCDRGGHASSGRTSSGCPAAPPASAPGRVRLSAAAGRTAVRGRRGRGAAPSAPAQHPPTWRCPRARASRPPRRLGLHRCPCQEMPAAGRRPAPGSLRHSPQTGALLAPSRPPPRGDRSPSARRGRGGPARCLPPRLSARCRPAARAVREADAAPGEEHPQRRRGGTPSRAPVPRPRAAETGSRAGGLGMGRGGTAGTRGLPCALLLRVAFLSPHFTLDRAAPELRAQAPRRSPEESSLKAAIFQPRCARTWRAGARPCVPEPVHRPPRRPPRQEGRRAGAFRRLDRASLTSSGPPACRRHWRAAV